MSIPVIAICDAVAIANEFVRELGLIKRIVVRAGYVCKERHLKNKEFEKKLNEKRSITSDPVTDWMTREEDHWTIYFSDEFGVIVQVSKDPELWEWGVISVVVYNDGVCELKSAPKFCGWKPR